VFIVQAGDQILDDYGTFRDMAVSSKILQSAEWVALALDAAAAASIRSAFQRNARSYLVLQDRCRRLHCAGRSECLSRVAGTYSHTATCTHAYTAAIHSHASASSFPWSPFHSPSHGR